MADDTDFGMSLGATLDPTYHLNQQVNVWRAAWAVGLGAVSIVVGAVTLQMLVRRPWRPTLMFIIALILSDWFKALWQVVYSSYWLAKKPTTSLSDDPWCQAQGFLYSWALEMSDFTLTAMLSYVVLGVALRNRESSRTTRVLADFGYFLWVAIPPMLAGLGFVGGNRYTNQGTTCYLPIRPFWYRLGLSWVPRYAMLFISCSAIAWLFYYVKSKHRSFMVLLKHPDKISTSAARLEGATAAHPPTTQLTLPRMEDVIPGADFGEMVAAPIGTTGGRRSPPVPELSINNLIGVEDLKDPSASNTINTFAEDSLDSSSEEMLRRLRRLWVYPLIYFLYWVFPFVYHATTYKTHYVYHPVAWLAGFSSSAVALHCTFMSAAVWVFERPAGPVPAADRGSSTVWQHMARCLRTAAGGSHCFFWAADKHRSSHEQRKSNDFAHQRLTIEMRERKDRARWSALSVNSPMSPGRSRVDSLA